MRPSSRSAPSGWRDHRVSPIERVSRWSLSTSWRPGPAPRVRATRLTADALPTTRRCSMPAVASSTASVASTTAVVSPGRIDTVDPHRRPAQIDERAGPRLHARRETRLLDAEAHIREDRGDIVDSAGRLRIAQQIESRQRGRRDLHRAGVGLAALDSCRHRFHLHIDTQAGQTNNLASSPGQSTHS